ncbi:MAG: hypothetical protein MJY89_07600 [Bacteroidales bacterium]|nr:hypothetical protein [Bacteroidales bacterium]
MAQNVNSPSDINKYLSVSTVSVKMILAALGIVAVGVVLWCFLGTISDTEHIKGVVFPSDGTSGVDIPNDGTVRDIFVHKGDKVTKGQTLALVSVAGAYSILSAPADGIVLSYIPENQSFKAFEDIVDLISVKEDKQVLNVTAYSDFSGKRFMQPGQEVQITPMNEIRERVGFVRGRIVHVSTYPTSKQEAVIKLQNPSIADEIFPDNNSVFEIEIEMNTSPDNPEQLDWSFPLKEPVDMSIGTFCNIEVIIRSRSVFEYLLENAQESTNKIRLWAKR